MKAQMLTEKDLQMASRQWIYWIREKKFVKFLYYQNNLYYVKVANNTVTLRPDEVDPFILHPYDAENLVKKEKLPKNVHCLQVGYIIYAMQCLERKGMDECIDCNQPTSNLKMRVNGTKSVEKAEFDESDSNILPLKNKVSKPSDDTSVVSEEKLKTGDIAIYKRTSQMVKIGKFDAFGYCEVTDCDSGEVIKLVMFSDLQKPKKTDLKKSKPTELKTETKTDKETKEEMEEDIVGEEEDVNEEEIEKEDEDETNEPELPGMPEKEPMIAPQISVQTATESQTGSGEQTLTSEPKKEELCTKCNKKPIYNKTRGLCKTCYNAPYNEKWKQKKQQKKIIKEKGKKTDVEKCPRCMFRSKNPDNEGEICNTCVAQKKVAEDRKRKKMEIETAKSTTDTSSSDVVKEITEQAKEKLTEEMPQTTCHDLGMGLTGIEIITTQTPPDESQYNKEWLQKTIGEMFDKKDEEIQKFKMRAENAEKQLAEMEKELQQLRIQLRMSELMETHLKRVKHEIKTLESAIDALLE